MRVLAGRFLLPMLGLAVGLGSIVALREATISRHEPMVHGTHTEVIIRASSNGAEHGQSLDELVAATFSLCRSEVNADVSRIDPEPKDHYRVVLSPALDRTNRRQIRGCLEDWLVDHLRIDLLAMRQLP